MFQDSLEPCLQDRPVGSEHQPLRVLVLDHDYASRLYAEEAIRRMGHLPTSVSTAAQALELLTSEAYDLVVTEVILPDMTCADFVQEVRRAAPDATLIALTSQAVEGERERLLSCGLRDYLAKPCPLHRLQACVGEWHGALLRHQQPPPPPTSDMVVVENTRSGGRRTDRTAELLELLPGLQSVSTYSNVELLGAVRVKRLQLADLRAAAQRLRAEVYAEVARFSELRSEATRCLSLGQDCSNSVLPVPLALFEETGRVRYSEGEI